MKKIGIALIIGIFLFSCGKSTKKNTDISEISEVKDSIADSSEEVEDSILLGIQKRSALEKEPYRIWFEEGYQNHVLDSSIVAKIDPLLEGVRIKTFMGTWCEDSQREIPALFKIIDETNFPEKDLQLITVSREKDTPENLEKGLDINYVPTIIFYKNEKELGRFVESARETLEKDILTILSGEPYQHTYAVE